jgi:hypothetical protein
VSLYEEASKKHPKDEEFGRHWFQQMILRNNIEGARKVSPGGVCGVNSGCNGIEQVTQSEKILLLASRYMESQFRIYPQCAMLSDFRVIAQMLNFVVFPCLWPRNWSTMLYRLRILSLRRLAKLSCCSPLCLLRWRSNFYKAMERNGPGISKLEGVMSTYFIMQRNSLNYEIFARME